MIQPVLSDCSLYFLRSQYLSFEPRQKSDFSKHRECCVREQKCLAKFLQDASFILAVIAFENVTPLCKDLGK